ncbi:transcription factor MYB60 isoform X2 [Manihot esculenta]|uniref:Transcription factor MYB60 n=2 Tax=Manihot esculenta TaxID=3983 RepID=A0A2C9VIH3_MANES|nr:transcription factor MYB60 isoform X2 [Manihot esculenta]OAY44447.1 hypothetical protein MANES_08G151100v8 [Manihot esculenta]UWU44326.1 MYB family transcription factor [Manihot esculenta]
MGRPPCCDKIGIKKGPWTPEEDIILVSYIQENGPGNWRSVPTNTGLLRCSKSCRLRWTNYLRPGIKRGNFTPHEEGMIIHLQALLGNKWAAIASYLPQRTDNDIKNYWNTHLKKKLKKSQSALDHNPMASQDSTTSTTHRFVSKGLFSERSRSLNLSPNSSSDLRLNQLTSSTYASSTENISRLLEGWMRSSPRPDNHGINDPWNKAEGSIENSVAATSLQCYRPKDELETGGGGGLISHEEFESILSFDQNLNNVAWDKSTCDSNTVSTVKVCRKNSENEEKEHEIITVAEKKQKSESNPPFSFLENWLWDETATAQVEELSPIF